MPAGDLAHIITRPSYRKLDVTLKDDFNKVLPSVHIKGQQPQEGLSELIGPLEDAAAILKYNF